MRRRLLPIVAILPGRDARGGSRFEGPHQPPGASSASFSLEPARQAPLTSLSELIFLSETAQEDGQRYTPLLKNAAKSHGLEIRVLRIDADQPVVTFASGAY